MRVSFILDRKLNKSIWIPMSRSNNSVRKLPVPGNSGDFVEAVFRPENFRIFSDDFRPVPAGKHGELTGIHRKKSGQFPVGILLPCSSHFRCFPAGSGAQNHRTGKGYDVVCSICGKLTYIFEEK